MRLVSNKESVARGEVSILAIVETLFAIVFVFYLSARFNTLQWLAAAMCVAPLLLLRTEKSTRRTIEWFDAIGNYVYGIFDRSIDSCGLVDSHSVFRPVFILPIWLALLMFLSIFYFTFGALITRFVATLITVVEYPASSLRAIPKNWARISLATDVFFSPEVVPDHPRWNWNGFNDLYRGAGSEFSFIFGAFPVEKLIVVSFCLPAVAYRWSLKATSIIYAPLVFVANSTFSETSDLRTRVELIKRGDLSRIRALYGIVTIFAFFVKLILMNKWAGFVEWWNRNPILEFAALYIAPSEIPKWQFAQIANSILAVGLMLFARHVVLRYDLKRPWPELPVKRLLGFVSALRWMLALYAIVCLAYITIREARHWQWPSLGEKWAPW